MATTKKWGVRIFGAIVLGLSGFFLLISDGSSGQTFAQDATLVSSATDLHPVEVFSVHADADSIQEAFQLAGVDYFPEDKISYFPDPSLGLNTVITVARALPVSLQDGKRVKTIRTWQDTVGKMLEEKRIVLGNEDRITPALDTPLTQDTKVAITRVARTEVSEFETIAFQTVERGNANMWRGETKLIQSGANGKREKKYLLIREDGELISKTLIANNIIEAAVNKIIEIGTKLRIGQVLTGKATWYDCCGTEVAMDAFRRGTEVRVTNLANGRSIIVTVDGCICGATGVLIDLHPSLFQQLGGTLGQGVMSSVRVEQIL